MRPDLVMPASYDGSSFSANTVSERAVLDQLKNLVDTLKKGRTAGKSILLADLNTLYNSGSPSLASLTSPYYQQKINQTDGWLEDAAKASGGIYQPGPPVGEGGVFVSYLFDENGLEPEQLIEKGLFGSLLFKLANEYLAGPISLKAVDRALAILGGNPSFPNSPTATNVSDPDIQFFTYVSRRDKNDGNGFYTQLKVQFIKLQAAVKAGKDYEKEQQEAAAQIRLLLEQVNGATIVNYCHAIISAMSSTNPTDLQKAGALHSLGECIGFLHGYRQLPSGNRKISDLQIDENLALLQAPIQAIPTCYKVVTSPETELNKLSQVIENMKLIYGFSGQQMEDFKKNWVNEQGR